MSIVNFDPAGLLHLNFRRESAGEKIFTFVNTDTTPYSIAGFDFELRVKRSSTRETNVLLLEIGSGLTIDVNELTVAVTGEQIDLPNDFYWWELLNVTTDETWLYGNLYVNEGVGEPISDIEVTISLETETLVVTIESTGASSAVSQFRGNFNPVGNVLPETGGSGAGGTVKAGDHWILTGELTISGKSYSTGSIIFAGEDEPAQDITKWRVLSVQL